LQAQAIWYVAILQHAGQGIAANVNQGFGGGIVKVNAEHLPGYQCFVIVLQGAQVVVAYAAQLLVLYVVGVEKIRERKRRRYRVVAQAQFKLVEKGKLPVADAVVYVQYHGGGLHVVVN